MTTRTIRQSAISGHLPGRPGRHWPCQPRRTHGNAFAPTSRQPPGWSRRRRAGAADAPGHAPVAGLLEVVGAGDATFLGPVVDEQSHCVRVDGSFFGGRFKLSNPSRPHDHGDRYFGHLEPTFNSTLPHHRPQAVPGSSKGMSASPAAMPGDILKTTVRPTTTSQRAASPTCPQVMRRFFSDQTIGID